MKMEREIEALELIERLGLTPKQEKAVKDLFVAYSLRYQETIRNNEKWYKKRINYWKGKAQHDNND